VKNEEKKVLRGILTQKKLKEWLEYNPDTGVWAWKVAVSNSTSHSLNKQGL